ncbi:MAG TPA: acetyl-CoA C-acetyltransferase [Bdellovibrionales bacterium]|nr:acetyl-CoA C-acetyltransferase [Bdellovibrionales bacterium]
MKPVFITSAVRTPIASFQGAFSELSAPKLGAIAIKEALKRSNVAPEKVDEVIMGEVLTAGVGQAPARQASIYAGIPNTTPCLTINKVCGSGLKAVMLASDSIALGNAEIAVAGGQENMTMAPHLLPASRAGFRMGNTQLIDSMQFDGLWDPYNNWAMGVAGELCAKEYGFTREQQDEFAVESYKRAQRASNEGVFKNEIVPVVIEGRKGAVTVDKDEEPFKTDFAKIPGLRPVFDKAGTITAANASKINDGAAAVVLMSEKAVKETDAKPLAKIISSGTFAHDPKWFTTAPIGAIKKAVEKAGLTVDQIDLFEINEAFANVTMVAMKELKLPSEKVNVNGGAVALGHPIGASGARVLTTLVHALQARNKKYGLATLCIGGGEAVAVVVERV